jgi:hypothetical protein
MTEIFEKTTSRIQTDEKIQTFLKLTNTEFRDFLKNFVEKSDLARKGFLILQKFPRVDGNSLTELESTFTECTSVFSQNLSILIQSLSPRLVLSLFRCLMDDTFVSLLTICKRINLLTCSDKDLLMFSLDLARLSGTFSVFGNNFKKEFRKILSELNNQSSEILVLLAQVVIMF